MTTSTMMKRRIEVQGEQHKDEGERHEGEGGMK